MCFSSDPSPVEPQPGVHHAVDLAGNSITTQSMFHIDDINIGSIESLVQDLQINAQVYSIVLSMGVDNNYWCKIISFCDVLVCVCGCVDILCVGCCVCEFSYIFKFWWNWFVLQLCMTLKCMKFYFLQIPLLQQYPQLKQCIKPSVEKAVQDLVSIVVERSIKVAVTTTEHIIKKVHSVF